MSVRLVSLLGAVAWVICAQMTTSTVTATVIDSSGAAIASADCELSSSATGAVLRTAATADGTCRFSSVLAGTYSLRITSKGFKAAEVKSIVVSSSEVRAIPFVTLEIGTLQESVSVTADAAVIQTQSAERSGLVTNSQLQNIALRGRDFFSFLTTMPGIVDDGTIRRETTSPNSIQGTFINGMRDNQKNFTADGISAMDTGSNYTVHFQPNMDAIAEVRVLTSNYQAES